jgi:hypothetical protein
VTGFDLTSPQFYSIEGWLFYLQQLGNTFLSYPLLAACLVALAYYSIKKEKYWKLLLLWFIVPYLIFTIIPNKQGRYLLPVIPALLFPLSFYISRFPKAFALVALVISGALLLYISYLTLPPGFYYMTNYSSIASETLNKSGNVLLLDEQNQWFYSSAFTFEMLRQDTSHTHLVIRPCILTTLNTGDFLGFIKNNGVRYIITTNSSYLPDKSMGTSKSLELVKSFVNKNATVYLYENMNYTPPNSTCNYICITNQWLCSNYANPMDALR